MTRTNREVSTRCDKMACAPANLSHTRAQARATARNPITDTDSIDYNNIRSVLIHSRRSIPKGWSQIPESLLIFNQICISTSQSSRCMDSDPFFRIDTPSSRPYAARRPRLGRTPAAPLGPCLPPSLSRVSPRFLAPTCTPANPRRLGRRLTRPAREGGRSPEIRGTRPEPSLLFQRLELLPGQGEALEAIDPGIRPGLSLVWIPTT